MDKTDTNTQTAVERGGFDPHTVFMKILAGDLPASFIFRDELVAAFMDIQPVNTGHILIVPNVAVARLAELDAETGARLFHIGQRIGAAIRRTDIACEGVNLFLADGIAAGQTVYHVHLHVLPRFENDGFRFQFPEGYYDPPSHETIEHAAEKIRAALADD